MASSLRATRVALAVGRTGWARAPAAAAQAPAAAPQAEGRCACGGGCPQCRPATVDPFEAEAERAALALVQGGAPARPNALRPGAGLAAPAAAPTGGRALAPVDRGYFEARLGADLRGVRLHDDPVAARRVGARAYTQAGHIVLDPAQAPPGTAAARALLAHELVHVVQQQRAGPAAGRLQRSAIAHVVSAGFDEQASVLRDRFEAHNRLRRPGAQARQAARFERDLARLDPAAQAREDAELATLEAERPGAARRQRARLQRQRRRAEERVGGPLPAFGEVIDIAVTYHYAPSQVLPGGQRYTFPASALLATQEKFASGRIQTGFHWQGREVGVRFRITFQKEPDAAAVQQVAAQPGRARMLAAPLAPAGQRQATYDYTTDPPVVNAPSGHHLGQAYDEQLEIDTEAIRQGSHQVTLFRRESHRAEGRAPLVQQHRPQGAELDGFLASVIAHEIGHNIGMIHDDRGIMADQLTQLHLKETTTTDSSQGMSTDVLREVLVRYPDNPVTPANIQRLLDRIPEMTAQGAGYWPAQRQAGGFADPPSPDTGLTVLQP